MIRKLPSYDRIIDSIRHTSVVCDNSNFGQALLTAIGKELDIAFLCIDELEERVRELEGKLNGRKD